MWEINEREKERESQLCVVLILRLIVSMLHFVCFGLLEVRECADLFGWRDTTEHIYFSKIKILRLMENILVLQTFVDRG